MNVPDTIKKVTVGQLRPGMFIHDLNCTWMDHPFVTNSFMVKNDKRVREIQSLGIREVYIDTIKGLDVEDAPTQAEVDSVIAQDMERIARQPVEEMRRVSLE
jgi:hypothetical protein